DELPETVVRCLAADHVAVRCLVRPCERIAVDGGVPGVAVPAGQIAGQRPRDREARIPQDRAGGDEVAVPLVAATRRSPRAVVGDLVLGYQPCRPFVLPVLWPDLVVGVVRDGMLDPQLRLRDLQALAL